MYYNETINCNCPPRCTELSFEKFVSTGQELQQCSILTATGGALGGGGGQGSTNAKAAEEPKQSHMLPKKAEEPEEKVNAEYKVDKYVIASFCCYFTYKVNINSFRENIAKVVIYFQSLSYQEITQYPKYTVKF